jgi:hypothetical protein
MRNMRGYNNAQGVMQGSYRIPHVVLSEPQIGAQIDCRTYVTMLSGYDGIYCLHVGAQPRLWRNMIFIMHRSASAAIDTERRRYDIV